MAHGWCHNFWVTFGVNEKTNSIREALDEALLNWPLGSEEDSILSLLQVILQKYITFPELNHGYFFFFLIFFLSPSSKIPTNFNGSRARLLVRDFEKSLLLSVWKYLYSLYSAGTTMVQKVRNTRKQCGWLQVIWHNALDPRAEFHERRWRLQVARFSNLI